MNNERNKKNASEAVVVEHAMVTGMFSDRESAENAFNSLHEKGYTNDDINLIMSNETRKKYFGSDLKTTEIGTKAAEGAGKGLAIGGTVGAVAGVLAALGTSIVIPGLGILIAGPLAAGLAGAGAGSMTGGVIGALVGAGIPEERAKLYETGVKNGHIVMGVHPHDDQDADYLEKAWIANKGKEVFR
jgi:hypothetical protein